MKDAHYSIYDFFARSPESALAFLAELAVWLRDQGAEMLSVTLNSQGPYYRVFRQAGFLGWKHLPLVLYVAPTVSVRNELYNQRGWHIMKADLD